MEQFNDAGFLGWNYLRFIAVAAHSCLVRLARRAIGFGFNAPFVRSPCLGFLRLRILEKTAKPT
jgi:hypothetical protein